ncbi:MAG TPA: hypothetical protein VNU45_18790 [Rummeliibacillus sp.]|nr:hypothetical protein [Rummeliibacillus sp.]
MAKLQKANKVVNVDDSQIAKYLLEGYDQISEDGKIIKHATGGRTVTIEEHNTVLKENEELKADIKVLEQENERLDKIAKQARQQGGAGQQHRK